MNETLTSKCDLLITNRDAIEKAFSWDYTEMTLVASSIYVGYDKVADTAKLKECEAILKKHTNIFSAFRDHVKMPILCKMAMSDDPETYFKDIQAVVEQLKGIKWIETDYKILAAMTLYDHAGLSEMPEAIQKMEELYHDMKENHPWLTSGEDVPFAAMLSVTDIDTDALTIEMENCYKELKNNFFDSDAVQSLSHVLATDSGDTRKKCDKVMEIFNLLKSKDHKFGSNNELAVLGTLALLEQDADTIVSDIIDADEYLKTKKGFGMFMGAKTRRMYAALMVLNTYTPASSLGNESAIDCVVTIMIAMEIVMIMMMCSVCVASSAH